MESNARLDVFVQLVATVGPDGTEFGARGNRALARGRLYF